MTLALALALAALAGPATAQERVVIVGNGRLVLVSEEGKYDKGYREGIKQGREDALRGMRYLPRYNRHFYQSNSISYRDGFLRGYRESYDGTMRYIRNQERHAGPPYDGHYGDQPWHPYDR